MGSSRAAERTLVPAGPPSSTAALVMGNRAGVGPAASERTRAGFLQAPPADPRPRVLASRRQPRAPRAGRCAGQAARRSRGAGGDRSRAARPPGGGRGGRGATLRAWVAARLPAYLVPARIVGSPTCREPRTARSIGAHCHRRPPSARSPVATSRRAMRLKRRRRGVGAAAQPAPDQHPTHSSVGRDRAAGSSIVARRAYVGIAERWTDGANFHPPDDSIGDDDSLAAGLDGAPAQPPDAARPARLRPGPAPTAITTLLLDSDAERASAGLLEVVDRRARRGTRRPMNPAPIAKYVGYWIGTGDLPGEPKRIEPKDGIEFTVE